MEKPRFPYNHTRQTLQQKLQLDGSFQWKPQKGSKWVHYMLWECTITGKCRIATIYGKGHLVLWGLTFFLTRWEMSDTAFEDEELSHALAGLWNRRVKFDCWRFSFWLWSWSISCGLTWLVVAKAAVDGPPFSCRNVDEVEAPPYKR